MKLSMIQRKPPKRGARIARGSLYKDIGWKKDNILRDREKKRRWIMEELNGTIRQITQEKIKYVDEKKILHVSEGTKSERKWKWKICR